MLKESLRNLVKLTSTLDLSIKRIVAISFISLALDMLVIGLAVPLSVMYISNQVVPDSIIYFENILGKYAIPILLVVIYLLRFGFQRAYSQWFYQKCCKQEVVLAKFILKSIYEGPYEKIRKINTGQFFKSLTGDVSGAIYLFLIPWVFLFVESFAVIGVFTFLIIYTGSVKALIAMMGVMAVLMTLYLKRNQSLLKALGEKQVQAEEQRIQRGKSYLDSIREIKVYNNPDYMMEPFIQASTAKSDAAAKNNLYQAMPRLIVETAMGIFLILAVTFIISKNAESSSLEAFGALVFAGLRLAPSASKMMGSVNSIAYGAKSVSELWRIVGSFSDQKEKFCKVGDHVSKLECYLKGENISPGYSNVALSAPVTFELNLGDRVRVMGQSGVGKTALLNVILGLSTPVSGRIDWNAEIYNSKRVGFVPQRVNIIEGTLLDNIRFGENIEEKLLREIYDQLGISQLSEFSNADSFYVQEQGLSISGGQAQRIGIARALSRRPSILVLDEATSGLDHASEKTILEYLKNLSSNMIIIAVTHNEENGWFFNKFIEVKRVAG